MIVVSLVGPDDTLNLILMSKGRVLQVAAEKVHNSVNIRIRLTAARRPHA